MYTMQFAGKLHHGKKTCLDDTLPKNNVKTIRPRQITII